jgi:hypothetical protein
MHGTQQGERTRPTGSVIRAVRVIEMKTKHLIIATWGIKGVRLPHRGQVAYHTRLRNKML